MRELAEWLVCTNTDEVVVSGKELEVRNHNRGNETTVDIVGFDETKLIIEIQLICPEGK